MLTYADISVEAVVQIVLHQIYQDKVEIRGFIKKSPIHMMSILLGKERLSVFLSQMVFIIISIIVLLNRSGSPSSQHSG
jgi:hypothetical protein